MIMNRNSILYIWLWTVIQYFIYDYERNSILYIYMIMNGNSILYIWLWTVIQYFMYDTVALDIIINQFVWFIKDT
jgi:hypothetical protein